MENFHLQNTDIKKIICDLGAHCLNRIPFIFWPVHLNNWIHLQTEKAVCLPSVKYKCSSKEKTSCSIPVSNSEQNSQLLFFFFLSMGGLIIKPQPVPISGAQGVNQVPVHLQRHCCHWCHRPEGRSTSQVSSKDLFNGKFRNKIK